jgi:antitoxin VapB
MLLLLKSAPLITYKLSFTPEIAMPITRNHRTEYARDMSVPSIAEVEVERFGDELRIRPVRPSLAGALDCFRQFSPGFMLQGRGEHEQSEREAL